MRGYGNFSDLTWLTSNPEDTKVMPLPALRSIDVVINGQYFPMKQINLDAAEKALRTVRDIREMMGLPLQHTQVIWEPADASFGI